MMNKLSRPVALITAVVVFHLHLFANDSTAVFPWKVTSKKTGDASYELIFSTQPVPGWLLYAPSQLSADIEVTTELRLNDSSITHGVNFSEITNPKTFSNTLWGAVKGYDSAASWSINIQFVDKDSVPARLPGKLLYTYGREPDIYYPNTEFPFVVELEGGIESETTIKIPSIDIRHPVNDCGDDDVQGKGLWGIFLLGLIGGFIALITPCVFPMIPLTVSFFTKQEGQNRKKGIFSASMYGFFIFLIYVLLSVPFHLFNVSPQILNSISTNVWLNLFFFAIFILFAISFFGFFEITLPGSLANRADSRSGLGLGGIFFMAFTLAIVSFSCTGPILGSLLVGAISGSGGPLELSFGMGGFGLGLALPFAIFAVFPNWLQAMPKSGGWLNSVKVVLGFLEVAMAIKFLSNADLVKQWGLVKREIFIGIWCVIGIAIVLYLSGRIRFPHDSPVRKFSKGRIAFIGLFTLATLYLIPGVTNTKWANLHLISGFPPPLCYSVYKNPVNCKRGFEPLRDYKEALKRAQAENKPILIDFTGWACVNCRRMEEAVWTDPLVDSFMRKKYVVVSLYVDEGRNLPVPDQITFTTSAGTQESIVTVGDKWGNFQIENFHATTQPQYAIISPDQKALTKTKAYTPSPDKFAEWLQCGLDAFEKVKVSRDGTAAQR
ncbi:MAG TPA: thioredoxin family protein [Chitinophagaceae bacterium]|nr:thioredoxin family protein [Chitinophagaceae bacterium]